MSESVPKHPHPAPSARTRTGRDRKFPLTLHRTGQYCKKIRGKMYYFGKDKQEALRRYHEQATALHTGEDRPAGAPSDETLTIRALCNMYLLHQLARVKKSEIQMEQYQDCQGRLKTFAVAIGLDRLVAEIKTFDLMSYCNKRIEAGRQPTTVNNELAIIKAMYHWALQAEVIEKAPNLDAVKKTPRKKKKRQTFTPEQIHALLNKANDQWKAMILLATNCGFGCTDVAELQWSNLNLDSGRVCFPRPKTDVERNFPLWTETVDALRKLPVRGDHVFYTKNGNTWGYRHKGKYDVKPITVAFKKLLKRAGIVTEKGAGFYSLRRTAATEAARKGNVFAVQGILGHADLAMASTYVQQQKLTPEVDQVVRDNHCWLFGQAISPGDSGPRQDSPESGAQTSAALERGGGQT